MTSSNKQNYDFGNDINDNNTMNDKGEKSGNSPRRPSVVHNNVAPVSSVKVPLGLKDESLNSMRSGSNNEINIDVRKQ